MKWFWKTLALKSRNESWASYAVAKIDSYIALSEIAESAALYQARIAAVESIPDDDVLLWLAEAITKHIDKTDVAGTTALAGEVCLYIGERITDRHLAQNVYTNLVIFLSLCATLGEKDRKELKISISAGECQRIIAKAMGRIDDPKGIALIASLSPDPLTPKKAGKRITDQKVLHKLAMSGGNFADVIPWERFTDKPLLSDIAANAKDNAMREHACAALGGHLWGGCVCERCRLARPHDWDENGVCRRCGMQHKCDFEYVCRCWQCQVKGDCIPGFFDRHWCEGCTPNIYVCRICGKEM